MTDSSETVNGTMKRFEQIAGIALVALLVFGCLLVLRPFLSSMLWAAILCYSTWPVFMMLKKLLRGRSTLAALLMVLLTALILVAPFVIVTVSLRDNVIVVTRHVDKLLHDGVPPPPPWVHKIPLAGKSLEDLWKKVMPPSSSPVTAPPLRSGDPVAASESPVVADLPGAPLVDQIRNTILESRGTLIKRGMGLAQGLLQGVIQLSISIFIAFFLYRDGDKVVGMVTSSIDRVAGDQTQHYLLVVGKTVRGVVYGILGTAIAQGAIATIGFLIVGAGSPLLLGVLTFFLALIIPAGPPLVWGGVAAWLFSNGETGWGVFMIIYGLLGVSGIDNVVRPYIISRGTNLPFVLVFFGVLGGVLAFGFLGFFLGPVFLVMGYGMLNEWIATRRHAISATTVPP